MKHTENQKTDHKTKAGSSKTRTIAGELIISIIFVVILVNSLAALLNYWLLMSNEKKLLELKADEYILYLTDSLEIPIWSIDDESVIKIAESYYNNDLVSRLKIEEDFNGNVLFSNNKESRYPLIKRSGNIRHGDQVIGHIELALTTQFYRERLGQLLRSSLITMFSVIVFLIAMTSFILRMALKKPFDLLIQRIVQISHGQYDHRGHTARHKEFETIISEFSHMALQIKKREAALVESEEYHRGLFENSPTAFYIQDYSKIEDKINRLNLTDPNDLKTHLCNHPEYTRELVREARIYRANKAAADLYKADSTGQLFKGLDSFLIENDHDPFIDQVVTFTNGMNVWEGEARNLDLKGNILNLLIRKSVIHRKENGLSKILVSVTDITELHKAYRDRERLEFKLIQAQKMEALGHLAGGVAHDLNNVLSGIVSYPDLLLMEMDKDSPLRKPITTIQNSGQKAAEIVQDLLTLARRGVITRNVLNLNPIINDYLASPELEKLKEHHPDIEINTHFADDLMNINGSSIHLRKTIMNLVSNAAEAQPSGGAIGIFTHNTYIDKPIKGYEEIREGDYVVAVVTDKGTGIREKDIKRIFEPFYTKKVMGRSGTGLGMAVVWGTVQDHKGYIRVESRWNEGTSFYLYFPATRDPADDEKDLAPIESYMGNGQTILIVDDIEEQREIASTILSRLNYNPVTVPSGESAIAYMERNSADLVVLDMIMDPGMDGLETYKQILALHPGQKTVIASGYSETSRVKQARELGAGTYIKKPYLMERIGIAVKEALNEN